MKKAPKKKQDKQADLPRKPASKLLTRTVTTPKGWQHLEYHPLSELVEFGAGISIESLAAHMAEHGYDADEAIILYPHERKNKILDGRHKHAAAIMAGVVPRFAEFQGKSPEAYVVKKALRQHLNESQRARLGNLMREISGVQICTLDQAAEVMNVSRRTVASDAKVRKKGTESLNELLEEGGTNVSQAAAVAGAPPEVQDAAVAAVRSGEVEKLTDALPKVEPETVDLNQGFATPPGPEPTVKQRKKKVKPEETDDIFDAFDLAWKVVAAGPDNVCKEFPSELFSDEITEARRLLNEFAALWVKWRQRLAAKIKRKPKQGTP